MDNLQVIGQRIRHYRKLSGLTQRELANRLNVAPRYIGNIEQGHRGPSLDMLVEICGWFCISMSDILPMDDQHDSDAKEKMIGEINIALRAMETNQLRLIKTMVCSL